MNPRNWFRRGAETDAPAAPALAAPAARTTTDGPEEVSLLQPQCGALTAAGDQCKRSARSGSKYCASHKGYRPPTAMDAMGANDTLPQVVGAKDTAPTVRGSAAKSEGIAQPQCGAVTASGDQCRRSARPSSKYCGIHKGYRPNAETAAAAKDTTPSNPRSPDTPPATRKSAGKKAAGGAATRKAAGRKSAPSKKANGKSAKPSDGAAGGRTHVSQGDFKLYRNGNRYYFSKKTPAEARAGGAEPVYEMPSGRKVVRTPNGLPVLKKT